MAPRASSDADFRLDRRCLHCRSRSCPSPWCNRAEPVAAPHEQGRIHHAGAFDAPEEELMALGGEMEAAGTLDRADALVWAITDLLVDAPDGERGPRVRWL